MVGDTETIDVHRTGQSLCSEATGTIPRIGINQLLLLSQLLHVCLFSIIFSFKSHLSYPFSCLCRRSSISELGCICNRSGLGRFIVLCEFFQALSVNPHVLGAHLLLSKLLDLLDG